MFTTRKKKNNNFVFNRQETRAIDCMQVLIIKLNITLTGIPKPNFSNTFPKDSSSASAQTLYSNMLSKNITTAFNFLRHFIYRELKLMAGWLMTFTSIVRVVNRANRASSPPSSPSAVREQHSANKQNLHFI